MYVCMNVCTTAGKSATGKDTRAPLLLYNAAARRGQLTARPVRERGLGMYNIAVTGPSGRQHMPVQQFVAPQPPQVLDNRY